MKNTRHIIIISIILILVLCTITSAQTKSYALNFKPYFGLNSGKTEYIMDLKYPDGGFTYFFKSQLEFPLDQTMFGCEIEYIISPGTPQEWAFTVGFYTQANDPSGIMYDHDWTNYPSRIYEKISYTESNAKGKNNILLVEFDKTVLIGKKGSLSISGGYKYQKIEQDIYGLKGWQIDLDGIKYEFEIPDTNGLYYEITYKLPNVGFRFNYFLNQKLNFNSRIAYTRAIISDFDDHLLRFKTTESSINGNGLLADFGLHMDF
ncbi:MAG: omptin family outer membrane protease, partial [bacterium]